MSSKKRGSTNANNNPNESNNTANHKHGPKVSVSIPSNSTNAVTLPFPLRFCVSGAKE
eukprot:m.154256 g.154256  ORF g.154256 m.154256 type:complete len:58 (-) comp13313_c6_seq1:2588-2761(-)